MLLAVFTSPLPPDIVISPEPNKLVPFIVFILVPDTKTDWTNISLLPNKEFPLIVFILVPLTRVACLLTNSGTVGKSAVPPKSPANLSFPFTLLVASGTEPDTKSSIAVKTKAVVANLVLLSPSNGVGAVGVPTKTGEFKGALTANAAISALDKGLFKSLVLSTEPNPISLLVYDNKVFTSGTVKSCTSELVTNLLPLSVRAGAKASFTLVIE